MPSSSGSSSRTYRRKNIFSCPAPQSRLIASVMLGAVAFLALHIGLALSLLRAFKLEAQSLPVNVDTIRDLEIIWAQQRATFFIQTALYGGGWFLLVGVLILYLSHKVMGPVGKLHRYVRDVVRGEQAPRQIHFRKGDFFVEMPEDFNAFQEFCGLDLSGPAPNGDSAPGNRNHASGGN